MARRLLLLGWVLTVTAALAALIVFGLASTGSSRVGHPAPALPHERLAGPPVTLASLRGHPALVTFWASWCGPCAREAPALERFSNFINTKNNPSGKARLVGVDWSDGLSGARSFVRRFGWTFSNLRDSDGTVGLAYRVTGLPTTFVIDSSGRIRATLRGPQDERSLERALVGVG
jgi:cytochrome c biogenesis protein CcmG/thiol:disulfide interchange protein DsbE